MSEADPDALTTLHARRAVAGDAASVGWLVQRLSPLLLAQARYRIGRGLQRLCDPEDLVNDVWAIALPRLADLDPRAERFTPVIVKFLSTTLLRRLNNLLRKHIYRGPTPAREGQTEDADLIQALPDETRGVVSRLVAAEERDAVAACLARLGATDREVIVLRGIEQNSTGAVAALLGIKEPAVRVRYHRALKNLRERLERSVFDDFPDD